MWELASLPSMVLVVILVVVYCASLCCPKLDSLTLQLQFDSYSMHFDFILIFRADIGIFILYNNIDVHILLHYSYMPYGTSWCTCMMHYNYYLYFYLADLTANMLVIIILLLNTDRLIRSRVMPIESKSSVDVYRYIDIFIIYKYIQIHIYIYA